MMSAQVSVGVIWQMLKLNIARSKESRNGKFHQINRIVSDKTDFWQQLWITFKKLFSFESFQIKTLGLDGLDLRFVLVT